MKELHRYMRNYKERNTAVDGTKLVDFLDVKPAVFFKQKLTVEYPYVLSRLELGGCWSRVIINMMCSESRKQLVIEGDAAK